jgi:hypothetical protein
VSLLFLVFLAPTELSSLLTAPSIGSQQKQLEPQLQSSQLVSPQLNISFDSMPSMASHEEQAPVELMPPKPQMNPLELLRKALQSGFCAESVEPQVRSRAVSVDTSLESTESWGLESILSHPFDNLKKVVQEITAGPKSDSDGTHCGSTLTSGSFDSDDAHKEKLDEDEVDVDEDDDEGNCVVIETHAGETGRTSRVLRSLETFFVTVLAVAGTLYLLQRQDVNFNIELQPKSSGEVNSSFISFAPRTLHGLATTERTETALSSIVKEPLPSRFQCDEVCENPCAPVLGDAVGECVCPVCKWQLTVGTF